MDNDRSWGWTWDYAKFSKAAALKAQAENTTKWQILQYVGERLGISVRSLQAYQTKKRMPPLALALKLERQFNSCFVILNEDAKRILDKAGGDTEMKDKYLNTVKEDLIIVLSLKEILQYLRKEEFEDERLLELKDTLRLFALVTPPSATEKINQFISKNLDSITYTDFFESCRNGTGHYNEDGVFIIENETGFFEAYFKILENLYQEFWMLADELTGH